MSTDTLSRDALLRAALLKKIQQQSHGVAPIVPAPRPAHVPLSLAQQRLWFLCELDPGASQASHISSALRLAGQLDHAAMEQAFAQLIARHESLRTHFAQEDGIPCQVVAGDLGGFALARRDLRGDADADARLSAELAESMQQPFDLGRGPLLRVGLWQMRDDEHVLLITMHHIITDGWSLGVLVRELAGLYAAACEGRALSLPPLPIQYADYAIWQRGEYGGEALDKQVAYWRTLLAGAPEGVELPTDHPRPAMQSHRGGSLPVALPETLSQDLRTFAAKAGVTPYMVLLAAWALWLARRSGQDDIVVGSPVAGRTRREIEGLIGFFVNTLALRVRLPQELTVVELLAQVKETTLSAFAHQAVPFEQVVDAVRPARSLGRTPLFQTMVALNNTPDAGELSLPGLTLSPCATSHTTTHFELSLALSDGGGALSGAIEYASDLFDEDTVRTFAQEWQRLLAGMLGNEAAEVWALPLMSAGESARLWHLQNDTASTYAQDSLLHEHFEARAAERPEAEALVCGELRLSYRELDARASRLATHLRARGVAPAARVALCVPRGAEMVVAMLAVLKAGAVYVPLDPEYPRDRLLHILQDATPQLVLRRAVDDTSLPEGPWQVLAWEQLPWTAPATVPAQARRNAESLCCLIYTSGSTGRPKGVMLRHRNLVNLATSTRPIAFAPGMRLAHAANIAFDAASWEIWGALCNGACLVVVSADELLDAERLSALLVREQVEVLHLTVGLFHQHAEAMAPAFSRLSALLFGGEKADAQKVRRLLASGHLPRRLIQCYGPTETTTFASCEVIDALPFAAKTVPLGRPLANMRLYVLDGRGEPVPEGVVGEIYIAGAGVSAGYWQNDALTLERFMPDPHGDMPDARMYRTGDLARRLADGRLEYMGRNDFQVKVRGYRIEPAEIETALCMCEGVREAVVIAREDVPGDRRLVAYVRCEDSATATSETFRASLASRLPEYMLPSAYVHMAEWPLTAHGKLDRSALPAPHEEARVARSYCAPEGETEQGLAGIWQGLLGVERVGRDDHFFEIGGHSLLVVRLRSQVRAAFGVDLPLKAVFNRPRLRELAAELQGLSRSDIGTIARADRSGHLPLSLAQQRLWFLTRFDERASLAYHMPSALRLTGTLNRAAMKAALDRLVARQEGLRARFVEVEGVPHQAFAPEDVGFALVEQDLAHLPADQLERVVRALAEEEAAAPFDFTQGPLIRGRLLRLADDEHVLLVTQHHIVSDGWSVAVMVREFAQLYAAFCERALGESWPDPLPPLEIQYADYAVWQRAWLQGEELERQIAFWRDHLGGAPALLTLPTDRPRPLVQSHAGATAVFELPAGLGHRLRALAQRHGVTPYMVVLAGWAALLSRLSGQQDVVIGTPVANRQRREVEGLLGFFVNTLALRVRLNARTDVAGLLVQVKDTVLAAFSHQELPFDQVVEAMQPVRSLSHGALVQTSFTWGGQSSDGPLELPGLTLTSMKSELATTQFDLSLNVAETEDAWSGAVVYASDLFHPETIERFIGCFATLLDAMAADDAACVAALPMLAGPERQRLLHAFNDTAADYPRDASIHELFEQQAARRADAVAVVSDGESISYGELNARANRLAHHLIAQGVGPDDRVAICIERSTDLIVGLLGILKAGGAYVPLDPSYPAERLAVLLEDSAPKVLIAHSETATHLPSTGVPVLRLDTDFPALARHLPAHDPDRGDKSGGDGKGPRSNHLAYVIYTSGSTGVPKGVMVEHRNVNRLVINNPYFQAGDDDCLVHAANPAFDAATWEIWGALLNGARLLVLPPADVLDARRFDAQLLAHGATALWMTVGLFNQYAPSMQASLARLRYLLVGGDALDPRTIRSLLAQAQRPAHLVNGYGPTETTTFACTHLIDALAEDAASVPIGRPIANTRAYILDVLGEPVPVGVAGEIHIGGDGVARGYLNQPALTAERFVRDPFVADPQARMYRTGDLGRWLPDGSIEYLGRNDFQVKLRGFRVELGEIEARLGACEGVREAVVLAREDVPGDKRLVAYLTADAELPVAELRARLSAQLPDYMVPSAFVVLDAFPLTPNGKLDRKALPAPDGASLARHEYEAPQGEIERVLAEIWQQLLGIERAGRNDHFFELGGHSLLAVQMVSHVRDRLGVEVSLRELFARPVLQAFAQTVRDAGSSTLGRIVKVGRERPLPLSLAQQRLWFIDQLDAAASRAYHMPAALRLSGRLHHDALKRALDTLVARQEGLRARLVAVEGVPHQVFAPEDAGFALQTLDLTSLAHDAREQAIVEQAAEEAGAPFDLSQGPLIRGRLLRTADEEHVLLITQHHIVSDGWSIGVIIREFAQLYAAYCEGRANPLPALEIQYADYAVWQRGWLQGDELEQQTAFWREHLSGAPALLELPTDRPRPPVQRYAGAVVPVALSAELAGQLRALAQAHGTTLFAVLLAGWSLLLSRLSGQDDVVVGAPVANRQRREVEALVGFFVNTLALRTRFAEPLTVSGLLAQVRETTLAAFAHQELPFEQVVEAVQPARSLSHSPLFQVMLSLNNTPGGDALALPGLTLSQVRSEHTIAQFDLSLSLNDGGAGLHGGIDYAVDLFDRSTVERFAGHFVTLLEAMVASDAQAVATLPIMTAAQQAQVLEGFNATATEYPKDALIHQLFEAQVDARPDALAVRDGSRSLSYGELEASANRLAHELIARGVGPDARVAICVERSVEMVVGLLGILKAGGAYVPLDPDYPPDRLAFMLEDSAPSLLLTQSSLADGLPAHAVATLCLDDAAAPWAARSAQRPDPQALGLGSRHLAYMIYTSGSTGLPKGVMNEHRGVVNRLLWAQREYRLDAADRVLQKTPFGFDVSVWEFFLPLLAGAGLVLARPGGHRDPDYLQALIEAERITTMHFVPSMLAEFVSQVRDARCRSLRQVLCSGEALPHGVLQRASQVLPQVALHNLYGPTEAAIDVTAWPCRVGAYGEVVPIGRPIANTRIYILDAQGAPVPMGVAGEIHIGGDGVARGYWNREALTQERFVRDPFDADPQARMYRTGDLGRWLADGNIEYLGRNDFQVKLRGFRIELGEIEARLAACAGVREAVVLAREDAPGDKRLVAYVVPAAGAEPTASQLREALQPQLPEYMVPSAFVVLDAFPLTPNGKLDREALPAPDGTSLTRREYEAPQGEIEQGLAEIWQSLLKIAQVGRHDHFFELGGHSLLAVQMTSQVRERLGVEVSLRELFVHPVLHAFAQAVGQARASTWGRIERVDRDRPLPLSLAQQRLWFIDQLDASASRAYHMPAALRLSGQLNRDALKAALDRVLVRQEGLRTRIIAVDGVPHQVFASEDIGFALAEHDLSRLPAEAREQAIREQAEAEAMAPFDFGQGPLIRGRLLRTADEEHVLLITQHHIVSDGWSTGVMVQEFAALYTAFCEGRDDPLPPLAIQYADYAAWQRDWLQGEELERQTAFWREHLTGAPSLLELPTDRPRPAMQRHAGGTLPVALPADLTARLKQLGQRQGATLFMVLLAGWSLLLSRLSGQGDVVVGTPVANRQRREVEALIGFFVNTLALRVRVGETARVADLLAQVKDTTLGAFAHQELPFEQVVEAVQPARSLSHSPLFQTMLSLDNTPAADDVQALPGLMLSSIAAEHSVAHFDLSLSLKGDGACLHGELEYAADLFDRTTIERFAGHFVTVLEAMATSDAQAVATLPIMTAAEQAQVLEGFNATATEYPKDALIHELFEQQAAESPHAEAVVCEARRLTYGELNARANQVAHHLLSQGVKPDDRVAICVERGLEMVVGLLGILKAGGAYVPLDPDYPAERLAYMLEDSAPVALLTQATLANRLPDRGVPTLRLDTGEAQALLATQPTHDPQARAHGLTSRHLAYMIYTSGSTGTPKGVMVEHLNATNLILSHRSCCELVASDRVLQFASFAFDASVEEIFPALCVGASIVVRPAELSLDSDSFSAYLDRHGVTVAELPTAFWHLWAQSVDEIRCRSLRLVVVGGEKAERRALQAWKRAGGTTGRRWLNTYGPTESTVYSAAIVFDEATPFPAGEIPIGRPIANTQIYILDAQGGPVPVGVAGEIHVGGDGVARGYWNREALTQERFVRDPFSTDPQARMYRTGDLGRWLADGSIEYLGRNDFQVKIRGFRIELGEIEARLSACEGVREAVVLAREDVPGDKRLVAYVVPTTGAEPTAAGLREALQPQLPEYMVPSAFVVLDAFPLTPNGKLDRKALPAPDGTSLTRREYEAPQGEIEQGLAEIWQQLLGIERVGRDDHFFELGGHSLLAVQMVSKVRERLGIELALRDLFLHSTLSALAGRMKAHVSTRIWSPLVPLKDAPGKPTLYMVPGVAMTAGSFWDLARSLDGRMNVHVLEARGLEEGQKPCTRMEDIVEMNLSAMRESGLPDGPIVLGGHSFGGSVAFEMARALEAAGHRVQLLLIDNLLVLPKQLRRMAAPELHGLLGADKRLKKLFDAQGDIYKRYKPSGRFHGTVDVIYARDGEIESLPEGERMQACRKYCEQSPVVSWVAGDHRSMLGAAHADELSDAIWQAWRRCRNDRPEVLVH
jgi:amino acid adenylation domain-containing protein